MNLQVINKITSLDHHMQFTSISSYSDQEHRLREIFSKSDLKASSYQSESFAYICSFEKLLKCRRMTQLCNQERRRGGAGGKRPCCPLLRGARGARVPFNGTIYFFKNFQFDGMKTMNLTLKSNSHRSLHWSY